MPVQGHNGVAAQCSFHHFVTGLGTAKNGPALATCLWTADEARPVVLTLSCQSQTSTGATPLEYALLANPSNLESGPFYYDTLGYADVHYGNGGAQFARRIDLRSGSYQLPPCSYVQVSLRRWELAAAPGQRDVLASASIAPGVCSDAVMPMATDYLVSRSGASGFDTLQRAPGARYFALLPASESSGSLPRDTQAFTPFCSLDCAGPSAFPSALGVGVQMGMVQEFIRVTYGGADATSFFAVQEVSF